MNHCLKWGTHFDLANKRDRVEELEHTMEEPGFWDDPNKSAAVVQDCKKLRRLSRDMRNFAMTKMIHLHL